MEREGETFAAGIGAEAEGRVLPEAAETGLWARPGDGVVPELIKKAHSPSLNHGNAPKKSSLAQSTNSSRSGSGSGEGHL